MAIEKTVNTWLQRQVRSLFGRFGLGYGMRYGSGGSVTQATSRTTAVTLDFWTGAITLFSAAGSTTPATFTVNCSKVRSTDTIVLSQKSGTDRYEMDATRVADGSFDITFNTKAGTTTEQPVFNFAIVRGAID